MELHKIESLLEKYFEAETSIAEENELKDYFSSSDVAQHLEQYKPLFGYFAQAKEQKSEQLLLFVSEQHKKSNKTWLSIAASIVVLIGVGTFTYFNYNSTPQHVALGTYDDPEEAFKQTQKALAMLSDHVNTGIGSVQYIEEYKSTVDKAFIAY